MCLQLLEPPGGETEAEKLEMLEAKLERAKEILSEIEDLKSLPGFLAPEDLENRLTMGSSFKPLRDCTETRSYKILKAGF